MSGVDVRDLTKEELRPGAFPADARADFRLHIAPEVRRGIEQHAKADVSIEICGVLVGHWGRDENGPYAAVTDYIRCDNASSKVAEVTFTHDAWAQINKEMDSKYADKRIVGWYHSHPDFGIFLSERDCFIQEHFFSGPGQVAFVIDPVRDLEGAFAWRNGKPTLLSHFWVGNDIRGLEASERSSGAESAVRTAASNARQAAQSTSWLDASWVGTAAMALALAMLFLLGYMYGARRSEWERRMTIAGAVAHFADTKLLRVGLEDELSAVQSRLTAATSALEKLPAANENLSKEQIAEATKAQKRISDNLALCQAAIARIEDHYALTDEERKVAAQITALKQAELRAQLDAATKRNVKQERPAGANAANATPSGTQAAPSERANARPSNR